MNNYRWLAILLFVWTVVAQAAPTPTCKASGVGFEVFNGKLRKEQCDAQGKLDGAHTRWYYNNTLVIDGAHPVIFQSSNKADSILVLEDGNDSNLGCTGRLFLLDLTGAKPRVFAFGVRNACNEFHWASWGKKRSVIAIKRNVKFIYENGKMTLPKKDNDLFSDIQPTKELTAVEKLEPFVEELQVR